MKACINKDESLISPLLICRLPAHERKDNCTKEVDCIFSSGFIEL
jgi:hypothetical protein